MVDRVIAEQRELGVIEKLTNINSFIDENPQASFVAHTPVFKLDRATTKFRIVYLSNLCETVSAQPGALNHNQCMLAGPCLNMKMLTSLLQQRFKP